MDDFGISQEYLQALCFAAGPLTKAQALSIQSVAPVSGVCVQQGQMESLPLTTGKERQGSGVWGNRAGCAPMSPAACLACAFLSLEAVELPAFHFPLLLFVG